MAQGRALVAIFALTVACFSVHPWVAGEAIIEAQGVCSAAAGCPKAAPELEQGGQGDASALLQHAATDRHKVKAHAIPQEGLSLGETSAQAGANSSLPSTRASEQPMMTDVKAAFEGLGSGQVLRVNLGRLFPNGYSKGYMPYSEHFQDIQRQQDENYLYITGSGETENKAHVFVAELASRPSTGAMGSNTVSKWGTPMNPPRKDILKKVLRVEGEYWHAGGATSFGNYLAVGAEAGCSSTERLFGQCSLESRIHFYDTSNPQSPKKLPYVITRKTASAGAVGLTQQKDGKFLLVVGRVDSEILDIYLSSGKSLESDPRFKKVKTWYKEALLAAPGQSADFGQYQNLHFVRQKDDKLFMVGTYRTSSGLGEDTADLFSVDCHSPWRLSIKKVASKHLSCGSGTCNFQAGAGLYVDSETSLIIYATNWEPQDNSIFVNEFVGKAGSGASHGWGR
mmetsp:Transcript_34068/g.86194  ORF Transcript_34068/g.86194 Transcript_34068/m.86194 type:complete len:453 (+) Transcript_34068:60-1418(+)